MTTFALNCLYVFLTALTFRIRGGLRIPFTDKKFPLNKWWFPIWFTYLACIICGYNIPFVISGLVATYMCTNISGWGHYIGALYGAPVNTDPYEDDANINKFLNTFDYKGWKFIDHPTAYGFVGLSLRGGLTTFILGLWLNSFLYMFVGLLQGSVYWFGGWICRHIKDDGKFGWKWSEWLWGGVLGLFLLLLL